MRKICSTCNGSGFVHPTDILNQVYVNSVQICTDCNGTGTVEEEIVGRTVEPDNDPLAKQIGYKPT